MSSREETPMCSFMMISHRGDITDSNLPRAHRTRASMRAGIRARHEATCLGGAGAARSRAREKIRYTATWAYVHWVK